MPAQGKRRGFQAAQRRPGLKTIFDRALKGRNNNGCHDQIRIVSPFQGFHNGYCLPRAALRLPWADMFWAFQADLCRTTRAHAPYPTSLMSSAWP